MVKHNFFGLDQMSNRAMTQNFKFFLIMAMLSCSIFSEGMDEIVPRKSITSIIKPPYQRSIGFTYNVGSLLSMTFEGRFLVGFVPNISLVVSPSFQHTPNLPLYSPQRKHWSRFNFQRFNIGLGFRAHFYEFDSFDGFFIEAMGRNGFTWFGDEPYNWSVIPSLMFGYSTVYESGYSASFGLGVEWEFLPGEKIGYYRDFLEKSYYMTKMPIMGEISLGWMWW